MTLVAIARNPIPSGTVVGLLVGHGGARLRYARWPGTLGPRKGTVCVFGGRGEFIEKYFETVSDLRRRGFAVAAMDWRGQGGSSRLLADPRKGHVEDFADFDRDLAIFMREIVLPDCPPPYFALAHSMGGNVLLRAALHKDCWFDRMVLSAPMIALTRPNLPASVLAALVGLCVFVGLGDSYVPGGSETPVELASEMAPLLTSDASRLARNRAVLDAAPELAVGAPTLGWVRAALASMRTIGDDDFPPSVHVPILMIAAGKDAIVSNRAIERLAARLRAGTQITIAGACHELLQERDDIRARFWAAFDAFIPGQ